MMVQDAKVSIKKHFYDIPSRILNGHVRSCGCLKRSSNELFISNFLTNNNIDYEEQYSFDDCRSDRNYPLYFDFALFIDNKLFCLIEYDGKQHFEANDFYGGIDGLKETQKRDLIKDTYCKKNNITLYRFPYTMTNNEIMEEITKIYNP